MAEQETTTQTADRLSGIALDGVASYQAELQNGAPVAARAAYRDSTEALHQLSEIGVDAGAAAATLRTEAAELAQKLGANSESSRLKQGEHDALVADATARISALSERAHALASVTEASLKASLIPALPDAATRALARGEIDRVTAGKKGAAAVSALRDLATGDPADAGLTAELFDGYTARIIGDPDSVAMMRTLTVAKLLQHPSNARRAAQMQGLGRARGSIDAARVAALTRMK
jgi:hypothetical protein